MTPEDISQEREHELRERERLAKIYLIVADDPTVSFALHYAFTQVALRIREGDDEGRLPEEPGYKRPHWTPETPEDHSRKTPIPTEPYPRP